MKTPFAALAAAALAAAAFPAVRASAAETDLDRSSARLAASLVLADLRYELRGKAADPAALEEAMLADPGANADPADARRNMEAVQAAAFSRDFADGARALLDRLAAPVSREEKFGAGFLAEAETAPPEAVAAAVAASFPAAFEKARRSAVGKQAAGLDSSVRPSPEEVESVPREELARTLSSRLEKAQKSAVFAENREYIAGTLVPEILDDAFAQRESQIAFVREAAATSPGFAPSAVAALLASGLESRIAERRAAAGAGFVYGPFPSVTGETVRAAALERASARFREAAAAAVVPFGEDEARAAIAADPAGHRRRERSMELFAPALRRAVREAAEKSLLSLAPAAERGEEEAFLRERADDPGFAGAVDARVRGEVLPRLAAVRDAIARDDFAAKCGALSDGTWVPAPVLVDSVCGADRDFRKTLRSWRRQPGLAVWASAAPEESILEETAAAIRAALLSAFEPGAAARAFQHKSVDSLYEPVKDAVAATGGSPGDSEIAALYASRVLAEWKDARGDVLGEAAADGRYEALFPSVEEKIRLLSKTMRERLDEERRKEETPPPEPETPPRPDSPPPEELEVEIGCELVFDRRGSDFEVTLRADGGDVGRFSCPSEPAAFKAGMESFSGAAASALASLLRERTKEGRVALKIRTEVRDGLIYWAAVSGVSAGIRETVALFGDAVKAEFSETE